MDCTELIRDVEPYMVALRRQFHRFPELSMQEEQTSRKIREELDRMKIPHRLAGPLGVVGRIEGAHAGRTLALRAEMDGISLTEASSNLRQEKAAVSQRPGVAHVCGHDAHMAMLLGAAEVLNGMRDRLRGNILLVFEQGEEAGLGVGKMLQALREEAPDAVWAIHLYAGLPSGKISVDPGARMAGAAAFRCEVSGDGGHASRPDQTIDPVQCTAEILVGLNSIISREINPYETAVLSTGVVRAGTAYNVIPSSAYFEGTMRFFELPVGDFMVDAFNRVAEHTAAAHRCTVETQMKKINPGLHNHWALARLARSSVAGAVGERCLAGCKPWLAADTLAYYFAEYPGVMAFLGTRNEVLGSGEAHHSPRFDVDDEVLQLGAAATVAFALDFLETDEVFEPEPPFDGD